VRRLVFLSWIVVMVVGALPIRQASGQNAESEITLQTLDESARQAAARDRETVVSMMSLRTMFPDESVRALARAAGNGNLSRIDELIEAGVDINARGTSGATPLYWALRNRSGFEHLLERGADPNVVFNDGDSILHTTVNMRDNRFLALALAHGGDPDLRATSRDQTLLHEAASWEGKDKVALLLEAGADIDAQRSNGETPIIAAALFGQFDLVYELLERGADFSIQNDYGNALPEIIALRRPTMDPDNELTHWMSRVIDWLAMRGVEIPDDFNRGLKTESDDG
jgi:ankyrin repeat protein